MQTEGAASIPQIPVVGLGESMDGLLGLDGCYYYRIHPDGDAGRLAIAGTYRYRPGEEPERILPFWDEAYAQLRVIGADEESVYYIRTEQSPYRVTLYRMERESEERTLLYEIGEEEGTAESWRLFADGTICVTTTADAGEDAPAAVHQTVLDGTGGMVITGLVLQTDLLSRYEDTHLLLGARAFESVKRADGTFDLQEDGVSVLPAGTSLVRIEQPASPFVDGVIAFYAKAQGNTGVLLLHRDGRNLDLEFAASGGYRREALTGLQAVGDYVLYYDDNWNRCYEIATGESWRLPASYEGTAVKCQNFVTDGDFLYCYQHFNKEETAAHQLWRIVREDGKPVELEFVETIMDQYGGR